MEQTVVDLELVFQVESTISQSQGVTLPTSPTLKSQHDVSGSNKGEIEVTLDPAFWETPLVFLNWPTSPFDGLGEAS